jgi:hypothetical protein
VDVFISHGNISGSFMKNPSVMIGIPSGSDWKADFGMSLAALVASAPRPLKGGGSLAQLNIANVKGSILSRSRHQLIKRAQEFGSTHILMVDSDMTFPNWAMHSMLAANVDVIAANCVTKVLPALPTARDKSADAWGAQVMSMDKKGFEKVWRIGTGMMLIRMSLFQKLPQPWFPITWEERNDDYTGEDWNFCKACQEIGIPVYVDHEVSREMGHIGSYTYDIHDIEENSHEQK